VAQDVGPKFKPQYCNNNKKSDIGIPATRKVAIKRRAVQGYIRGIDR
jgi:hypothetical protein